MPEIPKETTAPITLPAACPWGMVVYADTGAVMVQANEHMQTHYFDANADAVSIHDQFRFRLEGGWATILNKLESKGSWTGRVVPLLNQHGISSVEVMIYLDPTVTGRLWLYTMEHPTVNGALRFSSRSEMKILQVLLDNTLEYVFLRDTNGRFIITNSSFRSAVAGDGCPSPVGETLSTYISDESAVWIREIDKQVIAEGIPAVNQVSLFKFKNGTEHWLQMTTVPVRSSEGYIVGSVSVARDISDLKKTESDLREAIIEAKAASRAKGEFLAAMSHEIRTPINGIIGASELCLETRLDPEQRDYLDTVTQCSSTLMSLINDVLDFSKIEAGQLNLEKLNFCPRSLLEDIAEEFSQATRKNNVELVVGYDELLPHFVMGDPTRIKQILYNLIGNAVKFTEAGEIEIKADLLESDDSSAYIRFSVEDTGIGIDASRCEAIFSSFTQADMSTTRKYGGTGLGLSICKELVELMDGNIHVQSVPGKGSKFWIDVPFERSERHGAEAIPYNPELAGLRVLVVDDNQTNRDIYQQMCAGWGYRSSGAKDSLEALSLLEQAVTENDPYLLILLDQQMPGLSGLDLAGLVRSRPDMSESRIIMLSSALGRDEAERAKKIGISRALSKPVRRTTLLEVILETFEVDGAEARATPAVSDEEPADGGLHILLAEDNEINQKIACLRLKKLGHTVTVAENGLRVLELLKREVFDCILMDIQMPEMDGYQTTRRIRILESKEGRPSMHIIAMTAHAMKGDRERCLKSGMNDYISKPFKAEHLKEVLEAVDNRGIRDLETFTAKHEERATSFSERIMDLDSQDQEDILAVGEIFVRTLPDEIKRFGRALKSRDCQQTYFVAHSLKGVTGVFMCDRCVELAEEIEHACDRQNLERIDQLAEPLIKGLHALAAEIEAELQPQV